VTAKVVVVTGGSGGIGAAIGARFAADGDVVVLADVHDEPGAALASSLGCSFVHTDMSSDSDVQALIATAVERHGRIDVMCNNAGVLGPVADLVDSTVEDYGFVFSVNVLGVLLGTKHAAAAMIAGGRAGAIVNTASVAGLRGGVGPALYTASKHAVVGLTRAAASELARHHIRVNAVAPGVVPTAMAAANHTGDPTKVEEIAALLASRSPFGRAPAPDDIAGVVAFLASDAAAMVTGEVIHADAGSTMSSPRRAR
jgi:NAD(P)-dependent dehydrogenase (short-subunit alcohol dehydrogenase family)